jgi:hypothetical protein
MRARLGFVSNSSSSSFVVSYKKGKFDNLEEAIRASYKGIFDVSRAPGSVWERFMTELKHDVVYTLLDDVKTYEQTIADAKAYDDDWERTYADNIKRDTEGFEQFWITVPDGGDGGTMISSALRASLPNVYHDENIDFTRENL